MLFTTPYPKFAAKYICAVGLIICFAQFTWARPPSRTPVDVNIVAHQDDDILFMNPDILNAVVAGHRQVTVYITGGNIGRSDNDRDLCCDPSYPLAREAGAIAGYQKLLQLAHMIQNDPRHFDNFIETFEGDSRVPDGSCPSSSPPPYPNSCFPCTEHNSELTTMGTAIADYPAVGPTPTHIGSRDLPIVDIGGGLVRLIFLRVDSTLNGDAEPDCGFPNGAPPVSLAQLFTSGDSHLQIQSRFTQDGFTKQQLITQLVDILRFVQPDVVRTQDPADGHTVDYGLSSTTTTIGPDSDGQQLACPNIDPPPPVITINVASSAGFPSSGVVDITHAADGVHNAVTYTGTTSTTLTGCVGGSSQLAFGDVVTLPYHGEQIPNLACPYGPDYVNPQFYDHTDHVWGARFARQAIVRYDNLPNSQNQPTYFTYKDYNLEWNENPRTRVSTKDFCLKKSIMFHYAVHDGGSFGGGVNGVGEPPPDQQPPPFDCFNYWYIGYQKGQQQQAP